MSISELYLPTQIYFGKNSENDIGIILKKYNVKKVLICFGQRIIETNGLLKKIEEKITENKIEVVKLGGVIANPRVSLVRKGILLAKNEDVDFILAIGGGSVIDTAKAIGYGLANEGDIWDYYMGLKKVNGSYPVGVILTNAASGSEMSDTAVLTNDDGIPMKRGCSSKYCKPVFAILNPELTLSVPIYVTNCGIVDIIMHTLERWFHIGQSLELTDNFSIALLKTVMENGLKLQNNLNDYDARANIMWASSVSHNGLMALGNDNKGDWACHQIEHDLSALYDVAHGAGLSAIWASWARYVSIQNPQRFIDLGKKLFNLYDEKLIDVLKITINNLELFFKKLNMPINLKELGLKLTNDDIKTVSLKITNDDKRTIGSIITLNSSDVYNILMNANN